MPASARRNCLYLVGWFDEWDESVYRMEQKADGSWLDNPSVSATSSQFGLNKSFVANREIRPSVPPKADSFSTRL